MAFQNLKGICKKAVVAFQNLKGICKKAGEGLFAWACNGRTKENGFNVKGSKDILSFWGGEALAHNAQKIDAPSLKIFKAKFDGSLSSII